MVLQSEAHLINGVVVWSRTFSHGPDKFCKGHRLCKRIDRRLMHHPHVLGKRTLALNLTAQRHHTGKIAHRLANILLCPIRDRCSDEDVLFPGPTRQRDLESSEEGAEK